MTMSLPKILLALIGIAALAATGYHFANSNKEDTSAVIMGPSAPTPPSQSKVRAHVRENISTLSPIKEQLGGTFYVTNISTSNGAGVVEYEDGHNAYTADFKYSKNKAGEIVISDFVVRD